MTALDPGGFAFADEQEHMDRTGPEPDPDDARPAPEDRCVHCAGWGFFEDVDGEGLDGDLPCGHCGSTGLEPS